jgi:hypothetical protein
MLRARAQSEAVFSEDQAVNHVHPPKQNGPPVHPQRAVSYWAAGIDRITTPPAL